MVFNLPSWKCSNLPICIGKILGEAQFSFRLHYLLYSIARHLQVVYNVRLWWMSLSYLGIVAIVPNTLALPVHLGSDHILIIN